jgi:hypothetical protein
MAVRTRVSLFFWIWAGLCAGACALSGTGDSITGPIDTVRPALDALQVTSEDRLTITFTEPMLVPGVTSPVNYHVSGMGAGSLSAHPGNVSGSGPYTLAWPGEEMRDGEQLTVTASGLQDRLGNFIDTGASSASGTAMGIPPVFSVLTAEPAQARPGDRVTTFLYRLRAAQRRAGPAYQRQLRHNHQHRYIRRLFLCLYGASGRSPRSDNHQYHRF